MQASEIKVGNIIKFNGKLVKVTSRNHVQPGKGGAFVQLGLKSIENNNKYDHRFRVEENVDLISIYEEEAIFTYEQNGLFYFLNLSTTEEIVLDSNKLTENQIKLLQDGLNVMLLNCSEGYLGIKLPNNIELEVKYAPDFIKGQTAAPQEKRVETTSGLFIYTPQYVKTGDKIVVNSELEFIKRL